MYLYNILYMYVHNVLCVYMYIPDSIEVESSRVGVLFLLFLYVLVDDVQRPNLSAFLWSDLSQGGRTRTNVVMVT